MSESKQDQNSQKEKKSSGGRTLSLKGFDPKALQKGPSSGASGPLVEHKRRRPTAHAGNKSAATRPQQNQKPKAGPSKSGRIVSSNATMGAGGPNKLGGLSKAEMDARQKALSQAASQFAEDERRQEEAAEKLRLAEEKISREQEALKNEVSKSAEEPKAEPQEKKARLGPKILGQLKPEEYIGKTRSHLANSSEGRGRNDGGGRNNAQGGQGNRGRSDRQNASASQGGARHQRSNNTNNYTASSNTNPAHSNQRAEFSAPDGPSKPSSSRVKSKTKSRDDYAEVASTRKSLSSGKERQRKLTVTNADQADEVRSRSVASYRRKLDKQKKSMMEQDEKVKVYREVTIPDSITVQELANRMTERSADVVKELMKLGIMATLNKVIDADTAEIVVESLGHSFKRVSEADVEIATQVYEDSEDTLKPRAPVVTIMGHVDHGKTSLLDALRQTSIVSGEAGGITQHIGAYQVRLEDERRVTFIDTPGHAAFSEMRARGAKVTDIVVLVVAADDGVMPQTIEAIKHARASEVPIIVAINKIDKEGANPDQIRADLLQHEVIVESMSGEVMDVEVSAKERLNLDGLLDTILLQAEVLELKANPDRFGEGVVVEAQLDKGRGAVATLLVQHGNVKIGDIVVAGAAWGRVRALVNDLGDRVETAGPSVPVEVLGLGGVPFAGDSFMVVENDARAREITEYRERKIKEKANLATAKTLDSLMSQIKISEMKSMPVVIKGDVQGSVEAISAALEKLGNDEVKVQVVYSGAGGITESDVNLAETAGGVVLGFNVRANKQAKELAEDRKIEIRYYAIIYDLIDDIKMALSGMLAPELRENFLGNAEILEVFNITRVGNVAGCRVRDGLARRSAKVRLIRDDVVIHEGVLSTLRRFKDEVKEVQQGFECGMAFENYNDIRIGDVIEIFEIQEVERHLD
ncbi:MAG: translation initiation factor IF-2 [Pseudomonadota bacterium]